MSAARRGLGEMGGFVFDLDGCVWTGEVLVPGAADVLALLRKRGPARVVPHQQLARAVADAPGQARAARRRGGRRTRCSRRSRSWASSSPRTGGRRACSPSAAPSSSRRCSTAGTTLVPIERWKDAQVVVVGNDFAFSYERLTAAAARRAGGRPFRHPQYRPAPAARGRRLPARLRRDRRGGGGGGGRPAARGRQAGAPALRARAQADGADRDGRRDGGRQRRLRRPRRAPRRA